MLKRSWRILAGLIALGTLSVEACGGGPKLVPVSSTVLVTRRTIYRLWGGSTLLAQETGSGVKN